jgi:hypothetical protein
VKGGLRVLVSNAEGVTCLESKRLCVCACVCVFVCVRDDIKCFFEASLDLDSIKVLRSLFHGVPFSHA